MKISTPRNPCWGDFTFLFKTRKQNPVDPPDPLTTDPVATIRRRHIEAFHEDRDLRSRLREVWE